MKYTEIKENIKVGYDLNDSEDKKVIRDFEIEFEELKKAPLKYALWFYGKPKEIIPTFEFGNKKFPESINPRRVHNNITGMIDAGVVQHLLEVKAISRRYVKKERPGEGWAVGPDIKAYEDFCEKQRALEELKDKRVFAEQKNAESFEALVDSREELIESMKI